MRAQAIDTAAVPPTEFLAQHGYEIGEGAHSAADADLLLREGKPNGGAPIRRLNSGILLLLKDGRIGPAELAASERWASDYALGCLGASDPQRRGSSCRGDVHGWMSARLDAQTRHREATQLVGAIGDRLLIMFVHECKSFGRITDIFASEKIQTVDLRSKKAAFGRKAAMATRASTSRTAVTKAVIATLIALAELYASKSGPGKKDSWWIPRDDRSRTMLDVPRMQPIRHSDFASWPPALG